MPSPVPEPPRACGNCGSELAGHFCAICGQPNNSIKRPFLSLLRDFLHVVLDLDGRAYRSLFVLFTRPAFLSRAYINDQRFRFTPPLRMFLAISILFFVTVTLQNTLQSLSASMAQIEAEASSSGAATDSTAQQEDIGEPAIVDPETDESEGVQGVVEDEDLEDIFALIERINLPLVSAQTNTNLHAVMRQQARENYIALTENPGETLSGLLEYITLFMLAMMPFMALIQLILFIPARRYYIEHLVLTLHNTAFVIFVFFLQTLLSPVSDANIRFLSSFTDSMQSLLVLWLPVYLYLSLKFFIGWGWFVTLMLFLLASLLYLLLVSAGAVVLGLTLFLLF